MYYLLSDFYERVDRPIIRKQKKTFFAYTVFMKRRLLFKRYDTLDYCRFKNNHRESRIP